MHATDDVGDALRATTALLLPFAFDRWLRVAFVTFFLGGIGLNFSSPTTVSGGGDLPSGTPPDGFWLAFGLVATGAVLVGLAYAAVRGVMDLVLLESIREEEVRLREFWTARWRQGLRLFAFRLTVTLGALVVVSLPVGLVVLGSDAEGGGGLLFVGFVLLFPVVLVVPPVLALLKGFTTHFVAPVMVLEGGGVLEGWRRFWPTLRGNWTEFLAYAVVNAGLVVAGAAALWVTTVVGALVLAVPFLLVFGLGFLLRGVAEPLGLAVLGVGAVLYGVGAVLVAAFAKAPLMVFLREYALFVLGDVDADLDLVPVVREAVREADGPAAEADEPAPAAE